MPVQTSGVGDGEEAASSRGPPGTELHFTYDTTENLRGLPEVLEQMSSREPDSDGFA